jgi:peptidoglycan hydrolase-like protein with peptidoglycan-binding domain
MGCPMLQAPRFNRNVRLVEASSNSSRPLAEGESGEAVAIVQLALFDLGYKLPITTGGGRTLPDGIFGRETLSAIRDFQWSNGLAVDGLAGPRTLTALEDKIIALTDAQSKAIATKIRQRLSHRRYR